MRLIGPSKRGGVGQGQTKGQTRGQTTPSLGGCKGLILDLNNDCKDILEVLMKCRCRKCPQTQHLDQK